MAARERHPSDVVRLALGLAVFVTGVALARMSTVSAFERDVFHVVNDLPGALSYPLQTVMQLGTLWSVVAVTVLAVAFRRPWLALAVVVSGFGAYVAAHYAKLAVERGRPADVLTHVVLRGARVSGYGYPSGHTAVAAAIAAGAVPFLPRRARRAIWTLVVFVAIARVYVGAHLPLDVVGGAALGWMIGAFVHLAIGTPCHELDPALVERTMLASRFPLRDLQRVADDGTDATPYLATASSGARVFVKALDREHRDADALATLGRYVAFRHLEDEHPFATARQRVEHEALVASLAAQAGVHAARPLMVASSAGGPSVLVLEAIEGHPIGETGEQPLNKDTVAAIWREVERLHAARIAHRHLSLRNVMLDGNAQPWIIGFAFAEAGASDRALARDVAELLASLSLVVDPQLAVDCALDALGTEALAAALPVLQPLVLATTTRRALHAHHGRLDDVRDRAATAAGAPKVVLEPLTRIRVHQLVMLGSFAAVFYLLLPQMSELSDMAHAARHAELGWLVLAVLAGTATFIGAALSLSGAVLVPLAFGRTFVTQLASSFSNKITPAGLGGMGVNVRYLVKSGVSKGDAVGAVALNGTIGFMVHIAALAVAAVTLRNVGLPHVDLPSGWIVLIGFAALLSIVGIVLETSFGRKHVLLPTERTLRDLLAVVRRPSKAAQMFGGALLVLASYVVALGVALAAFHAHASWLDVTTVYLGGSAVASAAPTPGKVGAVEAALIAGLTGVGIASGPAVAGVLAFRLVTFWLPIAPGYLAFRTLSRRELL